MHFTPPSPLGQVARARTLTQTPLKQMGHMAAEAMPSQHDPDVHGAAAVAPQRLSSIWHSGLVGCMLHHRISE